MTEAEWLNSTDPQAMLTFLRDSGMLSERKARLFAVACCRRVWHLLSGGWSREAVEVAERFADGAASEEELSAAAVDIGTAGSFDPEHAGTRAAESAVWLDPGSASLHAAFAAARIFAPRHLRPTREAERGVHSGLLRDLFGNPFRPTPPLDPSVLQWNQVTVKRLADDAYENRLLSSGHLDPQHLAVLSDALEEAGADAELLKHLREQGTHWRGCWCLDLLLGKS